MENGDIIKPKDIVNWIKGELQKQSDNDVYINIEKIEVNDGDVSIKPRELPELGEGERLELEKDEEKKDKKDKKDKKIESEEIEEVKSNRQIIYPEGKEEEPGMGYTGLTQPGVWVEPRAKLDLDNEEDINKLIDEYINKHAKETHKYKFGDRVQLVHEPYSKGTFLEVQDSKPGDIDLLVFFDEPQVNKERVLEVNPTEIKYIGEANEKQLEEAKEAYKKYKEKKKKYEEDFEEKVENIIENEKIIEKEEKELEKSESIELDLENKEHINRLIDEYLLSKKAQIYPSLEECQRALRGMTLDPTKNYVCSEVDKGTGRYMIVVTPK
jgi:hypothetical protein